MPFPVLFPLIERALGGLAVNRVVDAFDAVDLLALTSTAAAAIAGAAAAQVTNTLTEDGVVRIRAHVQSTVQPAARQVQLSILRAGVTTVIEQRTVSSAAGHKLHVQFAELQGFLRAGDIVGVATGAGAIGDVGELYLRVWPLTR